MKVTLTFDLTIPTDIEEHRAAVNGVQLKAAIEEFQEWVRHCQDTGRWQFVPSDEIAAKLLELTEGLL